MGSDPNQNRAMEHSNVPGFPPSYDALSPRQPAYQQPIQPANHQAVPSPQQQSPYSQPGYFTPQQTPQQLPQQGTYFVSPQSTGGHPGMHPAAQPVYLASPHPQPQQVAYAYAPSQVGPAPGQLVYSPDGKVVGTTTAAPVVVQNGRSRSGAVAGGAAAGGCCGACCGACAACCCCCTVM